MSKELKPDATGTVVLSGHEDLALAFDLKLTFFEKLKEEVDEIKQQLRAAATGVLAAAGTDAQRVFFRSTAGKGGVGVSLPDYSKEGNRIALSDKKMSEASKLGELTSLGIPIEELIQEVVTEPGGDVVELRGRWLEWFKQYGMPHVTEGDPDVKFERRERTVVRRLVPTVISKLRTLATSGNELARHLIDTGTKNLVVKAER